jgi:hypothetical protein
LSVGFNGHCNPIQTPVTEVGEYLRTIRIIVHIAEENLQFLWVFAAISEWF